MAEGRLDCPGGLVRRCLHGERCPEHPKHSWTRGERGCGLGSTWEKHVSVFSRDKIKRNPQYMKTHNVKEGGVVWFRSSLATQLTFRALHSRRGHL